MTKRTSRRPFDGNVIVGGRNEGRTHKRRFLTWKIGGGAGLFGGEIKRKKEVQKEEGTTKKKERKKRTRTTGAPLPATVSQLASNRTETDKKKNDITHR